MGSKFRSILPNKENIKYVRNILLWVLFYFIYIILGGFCIIYLEKEDDTIRKKSKHNTFLDTLTKYNISLNNTMIKDIVSAAISASNVGALNKDNYSHLMDTSWNIGTGVFFSSSVITTIGYGSTTPFTTSGRLFTIFYAALGIPLTGIILGKVGAAITTAIKRADTYTEKHIQIFIGKLATAQKVKLYLRLYQLFFILFIIVIFFWFIPAAVMTVTENWTYMTAVYYCFITITTIGLGDIVPGGSEEGPAEFGSISFEEVKTMTAQLANLFYMVLGLSAISIAINLLTSLLNTLADASKEAAANIVSSKRVRKLTHALKHNKTDSITDDTLSETTSQKTIYSEFEANSDNTAFQKFLDTDLLTISQPGSNAGEQKKIHPSAIKEMNKNGIKMDDNDKCYLEDGLSAGLVTGSIAMNARQRELTKYSSTKNKKGFESKHSSESENYRDVLPIDYPLERPAAPQPIVYRDNDYHVESSTLSILSQRNTDRTIGSAYEVNDYGMDIQQKQNQLTINSPAIQPKLGRTRSPFNFTNENVNHNNSNTNINKDIPVHLLSSNNFQAPHSPNTLPAVNYRRYKLKYQTKDDNMPENNDDNDE